MLELRTPVDGEAAAQRYHPTFVFVFVAEFARVRVRTHVPVPVPVPVPAPPRVPLPPPICENYLYRQRKARTVFEIRGLGRRL